MCRGDGVGRGSADEQQPPVELRAHPYIDPASSVSVRRRASVLHNDRKITRGKRSINGVIAFRVPRDVIKAKCAPFLVRGSPGLRTRLVNDDVHTIIRTYVAEYQGLVEYYLLAGDVYRLNRVRWVMETSLLKTLACRHGSTASKMAARFKTTIQTPHGPRTCF